MPKKLTDCVKDVKAQGKSEDSAWGICVASTGEKPHKEVKEHHNPLDIPFGYEVKNRAMDKVQEKINENRQVPFFNPKVKDGSNKPDNRKTTKGIGGPRLDMESFLWKDILDGQLRRNVKEPKL